MLRENMAILHPFLFSSFFLFFILLHPRPQAMIGSGLNGGRQEPKSQREEPFFQIGGAMISRQWSKSHCFSSPSALLLVGPDFWQSRKVHSRLGLMKPQFSAGRLDKGSSKEPEDFRSMRSLGNWPLTVAGGLLRWRPLWACVSPILNSTHKCGGLNYGTDHPQALNWTLHGTVMEHITELNLETQSTEGKSELEVWPQPGQLLAKTKISAFLVGLK